MDTNILLMVSELTNKCWDVFLVTAHIVPNFSGHVQHIYWFISFGGLVSSWCSVNYNYSLNEIAKILKQLQVGLNYHPLDWQSGTLPCNQPTTAPHSMLHFLQFHAVALSSSLMPRVVKNTPTVMISFVTKFANIAVVWNVITRYSVFAKTII